MLESRRFEVPDRYRHVSDLEVRYASWDLSQVHLMDERTGKVLCRLFPQDKAQNASGIRRTRDPEVKEPPAQTDTDIPPLLKKLMKDQSDTGLPPAYLPMAERSKDEGDAS